jgi:hypothetical protein
MAACYFPLQRNHQGLGNALIVANPAEFAGGGVIARRGRADGMLNLYYREAA